ncbi:hypothetical protein D3C80_1337260 [compost metagenome]
MYVTAATALISGLALLASNVVIALPMTGSTFAANPSPSTALSTSPAAPVNFAKMATSPAEIPPVITPPNLRPPYNHSSAGTTQSVGNTATPIG